MTVEAIEKATGERPVGNRTAGGELSPDTLDLLLENMFIYDSSLRGSDLPYVVKADRGLKNPRRLMEIPHHTMKWTIFIYLRIILGRIFMLEC